MKFIKEHKILIIVICIVILLIVGTILFLNSRRPLTKGNRYDFSDEIIQLPNTVTYKSDELSSEHCLNKICISDAVFYYNDEIGRVEYNITNKSKKKVSGYLKMVFKEQSLIVAYKDLRPNDTIKSSSQYMGIKIEDTSDYELKKLTEKEIKEIIK